MKQGPARKAFSLWFIAGIIPNQFFSDAKVDLQKKSPQKAERRASSLGEPVACMSLSVIQFFQLSNNKVGRSFLNAGMDGVNAIMETFTLCGSLKIKNV